MEIKEGQKPLREFLSRTIFVPEGKNIDDLLRDMLRERIQLVIVVDEYGGTSGLITMETLVEEIVGDIHEEHEDPNGDEVVDLRDGSYLVDGRLLLEEFSQVFGCELSDPDVDTIAGYIFTKAGFIPKVGATFELGEGIHSEIAEADDRRIFKIKVTPPTPVTVPLH
jgi:magnesium and cobalt transporter